MIFPHYFSKRIVFLCCMMIGMLSHANARRAISELSEEDQKVMRGLSRLLLYEPVYQDPAVISYVLRISPYIDPNITYINGDTPLHVAVKTRDLGVIKTLITSGANTADKPNAAGQSPIDIARENNDSEIVAYFLGLGSDLKQQEDVNVYQALAARRRAISGEEDVPKQSRMRRQVKKEQEEAVVPKDMPARAGLLESIRQGHTLKKVKPNEVSKQLKENKERIEKLRKEWRGMPLQELEDVNMKFISKMIMPDPSMRSQLNEEYKALTEILTEKRKEAGIEEEPWV